MPRNSHKPVSGFAAAADRLASGVPKTVDIRDCFWHPHCMRIAKFVL